VPKIVPIGGQFRFLGVRKANEGEEEGEEERHGEGKFIKFYPEVKAMSVAAGQTIVKTCKKCKF
jgi:hypothetical protein